MRHDHIIRIRTLNERVRILKAENKKLSRELEERGKELNSLYNIIDPEQLRVVKPTIKVSQSPITPFND